ncbi:MAG: fibronectin type III domain-containing protein [Kibdelosporangium sp.]
MERSRRQRAGYIAGGLMVFAGAVFVLRNADTPSEQQPRTPPAQTSVREQADEGVLLPQSGARPATPGGLKVVPGPSRLQVQWDQRPEIAGYDVRLAGQRTKLTTGDAIQFDGLDNNAEYQVEVRAVDAFGQRSEPVTSKNRPDTKRPDESRYPLVDHFNGLVVPDPARWRLANNAACAKMGRGAGDDRGRLVVSAACGKESVAVRSRTPLRIENDNGELGRLMIETDAVDLGLDLVPGPVDLIDTPPPGSVSVRITPQQIVLPGVAPIPVRNNGLSVRWEFVLRTEGLQVWRDGFLVGLSPVVPTWTEATPLLSFTGPANGVNFVGIDAIGLSTAETPDFVPPPRVTVASPRGGPPVPIKGVLGGQLRITIQTGYGTVPEPFTVRVGSRTFPTRPAVAGQPYEPGKRYPLVADLPADALEMTSERRELVAVVQGDRRTVTQHIDIELRRDPASSMLETPKEGERVARLRPTLAMVAGALLNAAGEKIENGRASPRGRVVLEVTATGQGPLAGLAGIEVWVDNRRVAGLPADREGPGVTGKWRLALNAGTLQPGVHNLELKAISTEDGTSPQFASISWQVPG